MSIPIALELSIAQQGANRFWIRLESNISLSDCAVEHSESLFGKMMDPRACMFWDVLMVLYNVHNAKIHGRSLTIWRQSITVPWDKTIKDVEFFTRNYCIATGKIGG